MDVIALPLGKTMSESYQIRTQFRDVFLLGLNTVVENYTTGYFGLADARQAIEAIQKDEGEDWYEEVHLFGALTPKEKIVCLAKVAKMFLDCQDMKNDDWYQMWFQATCYVILNLGVYESLELEADSSSGEKENRKTFSEVYNTWLADHIKERVVKAVKPGSKKDWKEATEELWDSLVGSTAEPWADEDFMMVDDGYPPKSDESDFRRSLEYLLKITR